MDSHKKMSSSVRKFIRREKARIRRQFFDIKKQEEAITQIYSKLNNPAKEAGKEQNSSQPLKADIKKQESDKKAKPAKNQKLKKQSNKL